MKITSKFAFAYSLLEIIATIAIVAIITTIAVPSMNRYVVQSKVSDAINSAGGLQTLIARQIDDLETVTNSTATINLPASLGRYVASFSVNNDGVISITTTSSANSIPLTLTPAYDATNQRISWTCAVSNATYNDYVPSSCRI